MSDQSTNATEKQEFLNHSFLKMDDREAFFSKNEVCPLCSCSSNEGKALFSVLQLKWKIQILECPNCHLAYKEYFPTKDFQAKIYSANYVNFTKKMEIVHDSDIYQSRLKRIGKHQGRPLDYGCGTGEFIESALLSGWDRFVVDPFLPLEFL